MMGRNWNSRRNGCAKLGRKGRGCAAWVEEACVLTWVPYRFRLGLILSYFFMGRCSEVKWMESPKVDEGKPEG